MNIDLSTIPGLNLLKVSFLLKQRVAATFLNQEVGEYAGKFYLLDYTLNRCRRLTRGAFMHLASAWAFDGVAA